MKKINKILIGCFIALIGFTNCSREEVLEDVFESFLCTGLDWTEEVADELSAWATAASEYAKDPTKANCDHYKGTGVSYLDALKTVKICVPKKDKKEYNKVVADAKKEVDAINCE